MKRTSCSTASEVRGIDSSITPKPLCSRSQRESLVKFMGQTFNYGRGRIEHFLVNPGFFSPVFLLPLVFVLYL